MHRYYSLNVFLRHTFGERVQKVPLDAGFSCPNRDGTLSGSGCAFCNPSGSGSGLSGSMTLAEQWDHWRERLAKRYKVRLFMAYLQSKERLAQRRGPADLSLLGLRSIP